MASISLENLMIFKGKGVVALGVFFFFLPFLPFLFNGAAFAIGGVGAVVSAKEAVEKWEEGSICMHRYFSFCCSTVAVLL